MGHKDGCRAEKTVNIDLILPKEIHFTITGDNNQGVGLTFTADNLNFDKYVWNFDDGSELQEGSVVTHIYKNTGTYKVILTVYNNSCNSTVTVDKLISVKVPVCD